MARIILGIQPAREAIRVHGDKLERILLEHEGNPTLQALARFAEGRGVPVQLVPRSELDRRSKGGRHQGVIALAPELRLVPLEQLPTPPDPPAAIVALDGVMDPQN